FPSTIKTSVDDGLLHPDPVHYVTKHLQQGIESDHFRVKKNMPKIGGFQSFNTARRTIAGFEAMLWLRKGFGFCGGWTVNDQNALLGRLFGLHKVDNAGQCRPWLGDSCVQECLRPARNNSATAPMFRVGVVCGSYGGISLRKICTQSAGTGGDLQSAGSDRSPERVGMTIVPWGPTPSRR